MLVYLARTILKVIKHKAGTDQKKNIVDEFCLFAKHSGHSLFNALQELMGVCASLSQTRSFFISNVGEVTFSQPITFAAILRRLIDM